MTFWVVLGAIFAAIAAARFYHNKKRRQRLLAKYGDEATVDKIMRQVIWRGMSREQLIDSRGRPAAIDHEIYKTKVTETFKYNRYGKNRYHWRVQVDNGIVVGWKSKGR